MVRERLLGSWKSYKTQSGEKVKVSCPSNYQEFNFSMDGKVYLELTRDGYSTVSPLNRTWTVRKEPDTKGNPLFYLVLNDKLQYQIISLNEDVLVIKTLLGVVHFAREAKWHELVHSNVA